ncbi:MAG: hypothetical protein ACD_23C00326G0005 [uncultured bacterium]|nr:MAG: hypothetical protein ACD_23C00326G0005 [uncultured bacterium]
MKIHTLDITTQKNDSPRFFADLPDEPAVTLVMDRSNLAKTCGQPFNLQKLNWQAHQRALCIGLTEGKDAIALFYVSDTGLYAWSRIDRIYVIPLPDRHQWVSDSLKIGVTYWFSPSEMGSGHHKAQSLGGSSSILSRYKVLHQPPEHQKSPVSSKKKKTNDDDGDGVPPVLHPDDGFSPFMSLDDLGL